MLYPLYRISIDMGDIVISHRADKYTALINCNLPY